jgi:hypothetical protein
MEVPVLWFLSNRPRSIATGFLLLAAVPAFAAGPAERLGDFRPDLFPPGSLADAAVGGDHGARLVGTTTALQALGFKQDDVIVAAYGSPMVAEGWSPVLPREPDGEPPAPGRFVVWRAVSGERPVLSAAVVGRKVLDEFAALPDSAWAPMRLAVMLANQQTLVVLGGGILLVPAPHDFDSDLWLVSANPMPRGSEAALAAVVQAIVERTSIPPATAEDELRAAQEQLERRRYPEAVELAQRAMVAAVVNPQARSEGATLVAATRTDLQARQEQRLRRSRLLAPEPLVGIVVEAQVNRIEAFLPQKTMLRVDSSTGYCFLGGIRLRAPVNDIPVLSEIFLVAEYGIIKNTFVDPQGGAEVLKTTLQQVSFELMYRPRVESVLRPFLRGGVGIFPFSATGCSTEKVISRTEFGGVIGGGLDFYHIPAWNLRASVVGSYRLLHSKFNPDYAPLLERCTNAGVPLEDGFYDFDLDGWQVGLMLTLEL